MLHRNGVSEYSINGENCLLLDLQELLSDAVLGREVQFISRQGQLDTVPSASSLDWKAFIDEAAGALK